MAYVIFDTETTGLHPELGDRMIEIAGVRVKNGVITDETFDSLINPHRLISDEAARINGITNEMLAEAPESAVVIPQFLKFVGSDILVAHNAEFDMGFLREEMRRLSIPLEKMPSSLCTQGLSKEKIPGLPSYSLERLTNHLGIMVDRRHRALDDVLATAQLFLNIHHEEPTLF